MSESLRAEPPREPWRVRLAVLLGYMALGVLTTWPLAARMGTHVIQRGPALVDAGQGVWNMWWVRAALLSGQNPYLTGHIFYPERVNLFWQTLSLPNALLTLPALLPAGPVAAANLLILLSFGLGGYALYRLALAVSGDRTGALIAGAAFVCAPFHMQMILGGPLEIIAVHWIPLYLLLLLRALHRPGVARALAAAAGLLLTSLASQYYGLYCAIYSAFHILLAALLASERPPGSAHAGLAPRLRLLGVGLLVALVWAGTLLLFTGSPDTVGAAAPEDWLERQLYHSVALVDFLAPNVLHPLWGAAVASWLGRLHPFGVEAGALPGVTLALLALAGLRRFWARAWPWLALALLAALCAMGPQLQITNTPTGVPLLFSLFDLAGPFKNSSRPAYFVPVMLVPVCVLAAFGTAALRRGVSGWPGRLIPTGVGLLVLGELLVGAWPLLPVRPAAFAAALEAQPPGAVLELPPQNDRSQYMVNQICHGRPLAGGYLARTPDYPAAAFPSTMQRLWEAAPPAVDIFPVPPEAELSALGIRYVVLHPDAMTGRHAEAIRATLAQMPHAARLPSQNAEVYLIDAAPPAALALPGAGWHPVEQEAGRTWRWIGAEAELRLLARTPVRAMLRLRAAALARERPLRLELDGQRLAELRVPPGPPEQELALPLDLRPGLHTLRLLSPADPVADGRHLSLLFTSAFLDALPTDPHDITQPPETLPTTCAGQK